MRKLNILASSTSESSHWRPKVILFWHVVAGLLLASWWAPLGQQFWSGLDEWVALTLNGMLASGEHWQLFWAIANARIFDTAAAVLMIALLCHYIFYGGTKEELGRRLAEALFIGAFLLIVLGVTRQFLFSGVQRDSPSLILEPFYLLTDLLPDLKLHYKVVSNNSFPGDHATVVAMFTALFWTRAGWRYGLTAALMGTFFILPRLVGGAHWLTDIIMGGVVTAMITVSWATCSPLAETIITWLAKILNATGDRVEQTLRRSAR